VSDEAQERQVAPSTGAPQFAQKRPSAGAPQDGQVVVARSGTLENLPKALRALKALGALTGVFDQCRFPR
jgi:hypothetical protein